MLCASTQREGTNILDKAKGAMDFAPFYLTREFDERRQALKPEWASSYAPEPSLDSGVISDTPGDAAAASS